MSFHSHHTSLMLLAFFFRLSLSITNLPISDLENLLKWSKAADDNAFLSIPSGDSTDRRAVPVPNVGITSQHHHNKRTSFTIIHDCPPGYTFETSYCHEDITPNIQQQWYLKCTIVDFSRASLTNPSRVLIDGICPKGEYCAHFLNIPYGDPSGSVAFCIGLEGFIRYPIGQTKTPIVRHISGLSQIGLPPTGVGSSQYTLEAILTDSVDTGRLLNASSLSLQAQKAINVHGRISWQTLPGGMGSCTDCSSLSVGPVPDGTQSVAVDVMLEPGVMAGSLLLGSLKL